MARLQPTDAVSPTSWQVVDWLNESLRPRHTVSPMSREYYHNQQAVTVDRQQGVKLMKKTYSEPVLTTYGSVEAITQVFGSRSRNDFFIFSGNANVSNPSNPNPGAEGSIDGIVVPQ